MSNLGFRHQYVVLAKLSTKLQDFAIRGDLIGQNLALGVHAINSEVANQEILEANLQQVQQHNTIMSGGAVPSLSDLVVLSNNQKVYLVNDEITLLTNHQTWTAFLSVWLAPPPHTPRQ